MKKLLRVSTRGQVSLGSLAQYEMYEARLEADGTIVLVPVKTVPIRT